MIGRILLTISSSPTQPAPLGLPEWAPWVLIVVGGAILAMWWTGGRKAVQGNTQGAGAFGRLVRAARDRQNPPQRTPSAPGAIDPATREVVDTLLARLDDRAERLETLLRDAKETIALLEEISQTNTAPTRTPEPRTEPRTEHRGESDQPEPPVVEIAPAGRQDDPTRDSDPICTKVYAMADAGDDAVAIARRLDEHIGKVQLILALRER